MRYTWYISVRTRTGDARKIKIKGEVGQSAKTVYLKVKELRQKLVEKYEGKHITVDLISASQAFATRSKPEKGHLWCPYCVKHRISVDNTRLGTEECVVCGITSNDFWVKKYNGIFRREYLSTMRRKAT